MRSATALKVEPAPSAKPGICFVAPFAWPVFARDASIRLVGGAEVQQSILARLFARHGYRVSMVCLDFGQPERVELDGVTVHRAYRYEAGIPVLRFLHPRLTSLWRAMGAADADIYYQRSADMLTGVVSEFARRHGRRSIFAGASDQDFERGRQQIRFARDRWLFERGLEAVDRIVVQNPAQLRACRENYGRDAVLIPSVYELPEKTTAQERDLVLWVATVHEYKRPEIALEMARRLPHRRFAIIGGVGTQGTKLKPGYYEAIRDAAAKLPNVAFTGFLPLAEVEPWFDRAKVLLNTSAYEGMPNTFLQAWARGVPTVATVDVGARLDGKEIYRKFSEIEEGAAELERLFTDRHYWTRASERCLEYFRREHSCEEALKRYARVFESLR